MESNNKIGNPTIILIKCNNYKYKIVEEDSMINLVKNKGDGLIYMTIFISNHC